MNIGKNFDKTKVCLPFQGYSPRLPFPYKSIIIHTTNGAPNSLFVSEAKFLQNSKDVSAHFLVGKQGQIEQILDTKWQAWHAGRVRDNMYSNQYAIGIEVHFTPAEKHWTAEQEYALTWLVQQLPRLPLVTHRYAAIPAGRKIDPSGFSDQAFMKWSNNIHQEWQLLKTKYVANVRSTPMLGNNIIRKMPAGSMINAYPVNGENVLGSAVWHSMTDGYVHHSVVT